MSQDERDDPGCPEHLYRLKAVDFRPDSGAWSEYVCVRCDVPLLVPPGGTHPQTV